MASALLTLMEKGRIRFRETEDRPTSDSRWSAIRADFAEAMNTQREASPKASGRGHPAKDKMSESGVSTPRRPRIGEKSEDGFSEVVTAIDGKDGPRSSSGPRPLDPSFLRELTPSPASGGGALPLLDDGFLTELHSGSQERFPKIETPEADASLSLGLDAEDPNAHLLRARARRYFGQMLEDKDKSDLLAARMNARLALMFDPNNEQYRIAYDELAVALAERARASDVSGRSLARRLYQDAARAEAEGDLDGAIQLLERAISESEDAAFYNRLGVILATRMQDYGRAESLLRKASELAPKNEAYRHNLEKILSRG
jgi:tetratricopeptide (TPR) repeat protein